MKQLQRGQWHKPKADRGILKRGDTYYVRFRDQHGKTRVERVGPSKPLARKVYQQKRTEVAERRFFPQTGATF